MNRKLIVLLFIVIASLNLFSQDPDQSGIKQNDHELEHHDQHKNEIGIANSVVYFVKEKVFSYGFHLHYLYNIPKTKFGIGAGYERIFDEHGHNTIGIHASYRPIEPLSFNLSPGITFEDKGGSDPNFALHAEAAYEFEIKDFHIGPAIEFAYDPEDFHISLGLHFGYGF